MTTTNRASALSIRWAMYRLQEKMASGDQSAEEQLSGFEKLHFQDSVSVLASMQRFT